MHILDKMVAPGLSDGLGKLPIDRGRRLVAEACKLASANIASLDPEITELLESCLSDCSLSEVQVRSAVSYAEWADDQYFELKDGGAEEKVWLPWFQKARLATALAGAFGGSSSEDLANAVYELSVITENPSPLVELIRRGTAGKVQA